ncbi:MAG: mechanosensitive ion channel family protein [Oscillospiraceae bacterium]|nr:mechanosensitive ion channel family protein [Oscillospiraceae bacterium]
MMEMIKNWINMAGSFALANLLPAVIILVVGILVAKLVVKLVDSALEKSTLEKAAHSLIRSIVKTALYVVLLLIVAANLGIDVTGIVALASVLTLAVSLSVQNALTNLIGGFTLLSTKPFVSGDFVEIAGQSGAVKEIGLTYTKLTTGDNKIVSIPNSAVVSAQIVNYTVSGSRRVDINVSASYNTPVEAVLEALREAGAVETSLPDRTPFAAVKDYGDSAINYVLQVWCKSADYWTTLFNTNRRIKEVFDAKGIEMTYPHLNVHLDK